MLPPLIITLYKVFPNFPLVLAQVLNSLKPSLVNNQMATFTLIMLLFSLVYVTSQTEEESLSQLSPCLW